MSAQVEFGELRGHELRDRLERLYREAGKVAKEAARLADESYYLNVSRALAESADDLANAVASIGSACLRAEEHARDEAA